MEQRPEAQVEEGDAHVGGAMKISELHPDVRDAFKRLPSINFESWQSKLLIPILQFLGGRGEKCASVQRTIYHLEQASVRCYRPKAGGERAGLLWIHGGGLVMGRAAMNDALCNRYVRELGLTVISVEYRLAPKHRFPAAIDDCYEAWSWMLQNCDALEIDQDRIAVGGQSAGGGLSAALCQRIRDEGGPQPAGQLLFYPMLDDRTIGHPALTERVHIGWNNKQNEFGWSSYLGQNAGSHLEMPPWSVPARSKRLGGLPKAWIGVGDKDLFFDENKVYFQALQDAGVETIFLSVPGAPHAFDAFVPNANISKAFNDSADRFLSSSLKLTDGRNDH